MKSRQLIILLFSTLVISLDIGLASPTTRVVNDPVLDYIQRHNDRLRSSDEKNEHVLEFEIDVDGDGKTDVFLSSEKSSLMRGGDEGYENDVRSWDLYKNLGEGKYAVIDQEKSTVGSETYFHLSEFLFDPSKIYIGPISELGGSYGMLAMFYISKKNGAYIFAYVVGNGYFESKNFPDPAAAEVGMYHRDGDSENIPDMPDAYKHYFATPPTQTVTVLSQTF